MITPHDPISPVALARMEHDLPALRAAAARAATRRRTRRFAAVTCLALLPAALLLGRWPGATTPCTPVDPLAVSPRPSTTPPSSLIAFVTTDPNIAARLASASTTRVQPLGDAELARTLTEAGRPSGLVRIGGRTLWEHDFALAHPPASSD